VTSKDDLPSYGSLSHGYVRGGATIASSDSNRHLKVNLGRFTYFHHSSCYVLPLHRDSFAHIINLDDIVSSKSSNKRKIEDVSIQ
jgi:hypothetical protein